MHVPDNVTVTVKLSEEQTVVAISVSIVIVFTDRHPDTATQVDIGSELEVLA